MGYRLITVANPARISVKNDNLIIHTDEPHSLPIEDISVLILENHQITVTAYALSRLAKDGVCVFTCNGSHLPDGVYTPFCSHSRRPKVLWEQISASQPLRKKLWTVRKYSYSCRRTGRGKGKTSSGNADKYTFLVFFIIRYAKNPSETLSFRGFFAAPAISYRETQGSYDTAY